MDFFHSGEGGPSGRESHPRLRLKQLCITESWEPKAFAKRAGYPFLGGPLIFENTRFAAGGCNMNHPDNTNDSIPVSQYRTWIATKGARKIIVQRPKTISTSTTKG